MNSRTIMVSNIMAIVGIVSIVIIGAIQISTICIQLVKGVNAKSNLIL